LQGKFIRINFDMSGYIAGANIETCILFKLLFLKCLGILYKVIFSWLCKWFSLSVGCVCVFPHERHLCIV